MSLIEGPKTIKSFIAGLMKKKAPVVKSTVTLSGDNEEGKRVEPAPTYLFYVEISGILVAMFTECSGIGAKRTVTPLAEGGRNDYKHNLPGPMEYENLTLRRGLGTSRILWDWFELGKYDFQVKKVNLSIIQGAPGQGEEGFSAIKRWDVIRAYPVSWKLSDLSVSSTDSVAIETLELAHEGISLS